MQRQIFYFAEMEREDVEDDKKIYQCGECKFMVTIGVKDPIRCTECGYRILYKPRTRTWNQFIAR